MSKKVFYGGIAVAIAVFLVIVSNLIRGCTERRKVELEQQVAILKEEFIPMEFEISKYDDSEIKLKSVFYDLEGKKVGSQSVQLTGNELNFDFQVIKLSDSSFLFFPCGIYSELISINDSIKILQAYDHNGFPKIYNGILEAVDEKGKKLDSASKSSISDDIKLYYEAAKSGISDFSNTEAHGVAVHDIKNIAQFKKGFVYKVICHPHTGGVEIVKS